MAIALLGASAGPASAAIDRQSKVQAVRVNAPLPLDASLADPLWQPGLMPGD
ncbi:MAG: hypothetical protein JO347_02840, partial [Candidatus Eremiobacteraeota bacterium]|nr:hypothetical protein [Candidatus Eremiobacteraeota bacterium]